MGEPTIGIKVADGSYFPVLEHGFTGRKKLVLTTARDNQSRAQIDLYRGRDSSLSSARYIGSLIIENIAEAAKGTPEIELLVGLDREGQLSAEATDASTGESQRFSTSLAALPESDDLSDVELELEEGETLEEPSAADDEAVGEKETASERHGERRHGERRRRKGPSLVLLILFVVLGVLVVAAVAYFVYRSIQDSPAAAVPAAVAAAQPAPKPAAAQPAVQSTPKPAAAQPAAQPAAAPAKTASISYVIKWGDTLWDLSSTYYRSPWLYPKLAKANGIRNPDLIIAGTRITIPAN